jgi:uncharacterized phage protein gp47/JayE
MTPGIQAPADQRSLAELFAEILVRRPGYVPEWLPLDGAAGDGLAWIFARFLQVTVQRLNQAPDKNRLAFFDLLGIEQTPAQSARAPIVFQLTQSAADSHAPAATQVAAPPPPGSANQIVFETEQAVGVASATLAQVVSLWAGADEYLDHTAALTAGQAITLFDPLAMQPTPHHIYIAHNTLLALTGSVEVDVAFELTQPGSQVLQINWEYWDGQVWRGFKGMNPACAGISEPKLDGTAGFTRSGTFQLETDCAMAAQTSVNGIKAFWIRGELTEPLPPDPAVTLPQATLVRLTSVIQNQLTLQTSGLATGGVLPDTALANGTKLDLSATFYPLGQQPQPGSALYFSSDEVFGKPKANVQIAFVRAETPQDKLGATVTSTNNAGAVSSTDAPRLDHEVAWEYWNGTDWAPLDIATNTGAADFTASPADLNDTGQISFTVPDHMERTKVNGQDGYWIRVRLVSGGYGFSATVQVASANTSFTYVVAQPPALTAFRMGYVWNNGPFPAEHVITYNDFQFADVTEKTLWPGNGFSIFTPVSDISPAVYLGFDKQLPVDDLGYYFDFTEDPADELGPALVWEYWNGGAWVAFAVGDETQNLRLPGIVSFIGADDSQTLARFNAPRYWIRARLKEDGPPGSPTLNHIFANAVWASQRRTVTDAALGTGSGQENQVLVFTQIPVLEGERIEVQEVAGLRANVEWRIVAAEITGDPNAVAVLEQQLAQEGSATDFVYGDIRLVRDRTKAVSEVWVRWYAQTNFYSAGPQDRVYVINRALGQVQFGDGVNGRILPAGALVEATFFQTGGGAAGNVAAGAITQMLGSVAGVQGAANPEPAEGGSDGETLGAYSLRAPFTLRTRGRALSASDYETMAREASSAVGAAHALPAHDTSGRPRPGWVTLHIIPRSTDAQPRPSFGLREEVRRYIADRAPASVAALNQLNVIGPNYQPVDVRVTVAPFDPSEAGDLEQAVKTKLESFLHPLFGGPDGEGWPPGRSVYLSDVARALTGIPDLDYVEELALYKNGALEQGVVTIGPDQMVAAGQIRVNVTAAV